jgi:hypothetical protein
MKLYDHMESHLGPIIRGWGAPDDTHGIQVSLFAHTPEQDLNTFCTLGLSKHILSIGQKEVRQELLFSVSKCYSADAIASFLLTFAESIARSHHGLLRGAVVEGRPLIEGVTATGIYASVPVFWPDELQVFDESSPRPSSFGYYPWLGKQRRT